MNDIQNICMFVATSQVMAGALAVGAGHYGFATFCLGMTLVLLTEALVRKS